MSHGIDFQLEYGELLQFLFLPSKQLILTNLGGEELEVFESFFSYLREAKIKGSLSGLVRGSCLFLDH